MTVVFDAAGAPPGLPSSMTHRDVHVRFAKGYASADELLEEAQLARESAQAMVDRAGREAQQLVADAGEQ